MKDVRRDRHIAIVSGAVCSLLLVCAGLMLWHSWEADRQTPIENEMPRGDDALPEHENAEVKRYLEVEEGAQPLYEVLPLFTNENPASGPGALLPSQVSGFSVYWRQCSADDPSCFFREQRPDGTVACYRLRSGYEYKQGGRSGAEAYGLQEVSAGDPWQKAYLDAASCEVHYYILSDELQGTAKGDEQLQHVAPAGVDIYDLMELDPNLYDDYPLEIDDAEYEAGALKVRFAQGIDINQAADVVYSEGCWWSHYPELIRWEDEYAMLDKKYRPDPSTLSPDNYVVVRLPKGSSLDEYIGRFMSHSLVEECSLVGYSRGAVDSAMELVPLD